ncbi:MAG: site-specific integrase [Halobacteriovoraceae bacterium]|nr:site-specific integrase [Halobacteriovoraceae bacterium]
MGIIFDEKKDHFIVSYSRRHPVTKVPKTLKRQGIKSQREAERVYKDLILKMGEKFKENLHPYWKDMVYEFLEAYANTGVLKRTVKNCEECLRANTFNLWEDKRINEITTAMIRDFIQEEMSQFSPSHQKTLLKFVNYVFKYAVEKDILYKNPCPKLKFKKREKIKKVLTESEIKIFLKKSKQVNHEWFPVWALACFTGLRNGELFALKWESIDLKKRILYVRSSWNRVDGFKETKSGDDRVVEIARSLLPILKDLKATSKDDFVLPRLRDWVTGSQVHPLRAFLKECDLPLIRFHDLRASWATVMLSKGVEPIKVMAMGGWKELKTMQIYIRKSGIHIKGITDGLDFL